VRSLRGQVDEERRDRPVLFVVKEAYPSRTLFGCACSAAAAGGHVIRRGRHGSRDEPEAESIVSMKVRPLGGARAPVTRAKRRFREIAAAEGANFGPAPTKQSMDTITLSYHGQDVALAGRERFWLAAHIEALPTGHADKRHVCFMALYARDVLVGDMPGPYNDEDADRFARLALQPGSGSSGPPQ
jgi:hypothetical protein